MKTPGLMQPVPLLIASILRYAATAHPRREVVSRLVEEPTWRYDYAHLEARAGRAAKALRGLGVGPGDRVSSLAWNTHRHLELLYAVPGCGAILHTANPRLSAEQLIYTINHAGSSLLMFDRNLLPIVEAVAPRLDTVRKFVSLSGSSRSRNSALDILCYEDLLNAEEDSAYDWPLFDENSGAILCYTSGTTGDPKGVLYSHRAIVLHAMGSGLNAAFGLTSSDVVMPCASLYHATAWGLPYAAPLCGAKFVLPADRMDAETLHQLIVDEGVTFTGGVPTIWSMYLTYLRTNEKSPGTLRRLMIGGSAAPQAMARAFKSEYGVTTMQLWGMTETCPLGVICSPTFEIESALHRDGVDEYLWSRQGRLQYGIELKIVDEAGESCAWDGCTPGSLLVRGPWVVHRYYRQEQDAVDSQGWFNTGDIATMDKHGFMQITDRAKDVIKSGGEWISSIELENAAAGFPGVRLAAAVGVYHPKWEERPLLIIEPHEKSAVVKEEIRSYLAAKIIRWWLPDDIVFDSIPLTSTGKIDKKVLRNKYARHLANGR